MKYIKPFKLNEDYSDRDIKYIMAELTDDVNKINKLANKYKNVSLRIEDQDMITSRKMYDMSDDLYVRSIKLMDFGNRFDESFDRLDKSSIYKFESLFMKNIGYLRSALRELKYVFRNVSNVNENVISDVINSVKLIYNKVNQFFIKFDESIQEFNRILKSVENERPNRYKKRNFKKF